MGATKKFIDFIIEFLPNKPKNKPSDGIHPWEVEDIENSLRIIYDYRSKALHGGIRFPAPMCLPPYIEKGNKIHELPMVLATSTKGGVWLKKDTPMLLHLFEYIVRGSILKWWDSLVS